MVNPAAQTHCRCQSPDQSTAGKRHGRSAAHMASIAWLLIATSSITSLEIDMPHLLLIHCSDGTPPQRERRAGSAAAASDLWLFVGARERDPYRDRVRGRLRLNLSILAFNFPCQLSCLHAGEFNSS